MRRFVPPDRPPPDRGDPAMDLEEMMGKPVGEIGKVSQVDGTEIVDHPAIISAAPPPGQAFLETRSVALRHMWVSIWHRMGPRHAVLRGRSPIGRGRALKPPPVWVRIPPSPPRSCIHIASGLCP